VRIHAVVRELANENIDVLEWSDDPKKLISRALSPAEPVSVKLNTDAEPPRARVEVVSDEVSQAIGKGGVNIRLASQLTGFEIDVYREIPADEEDIDIEEFGDELSDETIEKLKFIGCDTGKAVLELSVDELGRRAGLDRDTAKSVLDIIKTEFEEGPGIPQQLERGQFTIESPVDEEPEEADEADADAAEEDAAEEDAAEASDADEDEADEADANDAPTELVGDEEAPEGEAEVAGSEEKQVES
jgi:N utilization substance protein A